MIPVRRLKKSIKKMNLKTTTKMHHRILGDLLKVMEKSKQTKLASTQPNIRRNILLIKVGSLAAAFLIISSLTVSFVLFRKNTELRDELAQRDAAIAQNGDSVTINFYLKEHQDFIAQQASLDSAASQQMQMQISPDDLMYYELFGNLPEFLNSGMIIRGPSSRQGIDSSETPAISNGHTLTLSEARKTVDFNLVAPQMLHPGFRLNKIRKIDDRDALHLLYTDNIQTVSLFEQHLEGERGLSHQDFREYAVYNNQGEGRGTILAWRDDTLSYVLIGNLEISQLMNIAQSISAGK